MARNVINPFAQKSLGNKGWENFRKLISEAAENKQDLLELKETMRYNKDKIRLDEIKEANRNSEAQAKISLDNSKHFKTTFYDGIHNATTSDSIKDISEAESSLGKLEDGTYKYDAIKSNMVSENLSGNFLSGQELASKLGSRKSLLQKIVTYERDIMTGDPERQSQIMEDVFAMAQTGDISQTKFAQFLTKAKTNKVPGYHTVDKPGGLSTTAAAGNFSSIYRNIDNFYKYSSPTSVNIKDWISSKDNANKLAVSYDNKDTKKQVINQFNMETADKAGQLLRDLAAGELSVQTFESIPERGKQAMFANLGGIALESIYALKTTDSKNYARHLDKNPASKAELVAKIESVLGPKENWIKYLEVDKKGQLKYPNARLKILDE